ncbi:MAG: hypothetical protein ACTSVV_11645, partial [Promethearchaeota archaeon]
MSSINKPKSKEIEEEKILLEEEKKHDSEEKKRRNKTNQKKEYDRKLDKQLFIPIVKQENLTINIKKIPFNDKIPKINDQKKSIKLPLIKIENELPISRKFFTFNSDLLPEFIIKERKFSIPIIRATEYDVIRKTIKFNNQIPQLGKKILSVPIIELCEKPVTTRKLININNKIPNIFNNDIRHLSQEKDGEEIPFKTDNSGAIISDEEEKEELTFFGINTKIIGSSPILILFNDKKNNFTGTLEEILKMFYREIKGGYPTSRKISKLEETYIRELEQTLKAEDRIITIDFQDVKDTNDINLNNIKDRLEQLFSQDLGFILFKNSSLITDKFIPQDHFIKIYSCNPNDLLLDNLEAQKELCQFLWGSINIRDNELNFSRKNLTFDMIFHFCKKKYENYFKTILKEPYLTITRRDLNKEESETHFNLKLYVVSFLIKSMGLNHKADFLEIREIIRVEEKLSSITPDIYVFNKAKQFANETFEIETLFGQGVAAIKKIDETIEKYEKEESSGIQKLNIVLENFTIFNNFKEIKEKIKIHENLKNHKKRDFDLEFWGLNLAEKSLLSFQEIEKK